MAKIIKNIDTVSHTYVGQLIEVDSSYALQAHEELAFSINDSLISDIANGKAQMNDGISDIVGVANQIAFLNGNIKEVVTQFEKDDKTLKLISSSASVNEDGEAEVLIKVPGTFQGTTSDKPGRFVDWGKSWFSAQHEGDIVTNVEVVDVDNILGYGAGLVLKTYHDDEAPSENHGWIIPKHEGSIQVEALGGYGFIPAEIYLRVKAKKGESQISGTFYLNIKWGKKE